MPLIPSKNPTALIGYYLGIGCLIPLLGFALAIPALVCGIIGVVKASAKPEVGGKGHAITAIVLSIVGPLAWVVGLYAFGRSG